MPGANQTMSRRTKQIAGGMLLGVLALTAGCQDLDVVNLNNPDRERALTEPGDMETLIASSWTQFWTTTNTSQQRVWPGAVYGMEFTTTIANNGILQFVQEPRRQFDNTPGSDMTETARFHWQGLYSDLSSAIEGLITLDQGMTIPDPEDSSVDNTDRARAFAMFNKALMHQYVGLLFDQGWVITEEDTDLQEYLRSERGEFRPYPEVLEASYGFWMELLDFLDQNPGVVFPSSWMNGNEMNAARIREVAHSFIVQGLVYGARTPEERRDVDWNLVLQHLDQAITEDFGFETESGGLTFSEYRWRTGTTWFQTSYYLIGPGDTSGQFQAWLAADPNDRERFQFVSPDHRLVHENEDGEVVSGELFFLRPNSVLRPERGPYLDSYYAWNRNQEGPWGFKTVMTVRENNLIRAEAYIRLGQPELALGYINEYRTSTGQFGGGLPPVTVQGAPHSSEGADDCVPRMRDGSCADLMNALNYERRLMSLGNNAQRSWLDGRGMGTLLEGTPLHLPVPGRELEQLGMPVYTFGGVGGMDASTGPGVDVIWLN